MPGKHRAIVAAVALVLVAAGTVTWHPLVRARRPDLSGARGSSGDTAATSAASGSPVEAGALAVSGLVGTKWAVLIGVDLYDDSRFDPLRFCGSDVLALRDMLVRTAGFPANQVIVLHDKHTDRQQFPRRLVIESTLRLVLANVRPPDLLLVSFSGHGMHLRGTSYLCPSDANQDEPAVTMLSLRQLYLRLERECLAAQKVVFIDACRNDPRGARSATSGMTAGLAESIKQVPEGVLVLASCRAEQVSSEDEELKHGVFMNFLMEGLSGKADQRADGYQEGNQNGCVDVDELFNYAAFHTGKFALLRRKPAQTPELWGTRSGAPIILADSFVDPLALLRRAREAVIASGNSGTLNILGEIAYLQCKAGSQEAARETTNLLLGLTRLRHSNANAPGGDLATFHRELAVVATSQIGARLLSDAEALSRELPTGPLQAEILSLLAAAHFREGQRQSAERSLRECETLVSAASTAKSDQWDRARAGLTVAYACDNRLSDAERLLPEIKHLVLKSDALDAIAIAHVRLRHFSEAVATVKGEQVVWSQDNILESRHLLPGCPPTGLLTLCRIMEMQAALSERAAALNVLSEALKAMKASSSTELGSRLLILYTMAALNETQVVGRTLAEMAGLITSVEYGRESLRAHWAVVQHKVGNLDACRRILNTEVQEALDGKFPNQDMVTLCLAYAEIGDSEECLRVVREAFEGKGTRDPGIAADWPEVIRTLTRRGTHREADKAKAIFVKYFPSWTLDIELARGVLQARGAIPRDVFGATRAFLSPSSRGRRLRPDGEPDEAASSWRP